MPQPRAAATCSSQSFAADHAVNRFATSPIFARFMHSETANIGLTVEVVFADCIGGMGNVTAPGNCTAPGNDTADGA